MQMRFPMDGNGIYQTLISGYLLRLLEYIISGEKSNFVIPQENNLTHREKVGLSGKEETHKWSFTGGKLVLSQ